MTPLHPIVRLEGPALKPEESFFSHTGESKNLIGDKLLWQNVFPLIFPNAVSVWIKES